MTTAIDLRWPIHNGRRIPLLHQYQTLSAIARVIPSIHQENQIGIHPIRGIRLEPGYLEMTRDSALTVRTPVDRVPSLLVLSGKKFDIGGFEIRLGVPQVLSLDPSRCLRSFLVTIKGYLESNAFENGVRRQLQAATISPSVVVSIGPRRILRIKEATIVGYEVQLDGLSPSDSLLIQQHGIGGRRHMGCGLFNPDRPAAHEGED